MPKPRAMAPCLTPWPRESGLGYSLSLGRVRGELHPDRPDGDDARFCWSGYLWIDGERHVIVGEVQEDNPWDAGDALAALAREVSGG